MKKKQLIIGLGIVGILLLLIGFLLFKKNGKNGIQNFRC